jgi:hypothetical protein
MRRIAVVVAVAALALSPFIGGAAIGAEGVAKTPKVHLPDNATVRLAGLQHFCGSNGIQCSEPVGPWDETAGFSKAIQNGAKLLPYIGHDEPMVQFFSNRPGTGNDVSYLLQLPKDPPTLPRQDGSGGTFTFQDSITFWFGMQLCDSQGAPNPDGAALSGHPTVPCTPDSDSNLYASTNPASSRYFGLGPGQGFMEMQFYPPGWVSWPAGTGCTATQWCAALNIDTFQDNENTGDVNNTACLNTVGPEPVNFAFVTKSGVASTPANPGNPAHFVPDLKNDLLMNSGDSIAMHMFDTANGLRITLNDVTAHRSGSMTASAANGFGNVLFAPKAKKCTILLNDYHPMYSTANPAGRNFNAAHTGNISFSDEIGHFEYCAKVRNDAIASCAKPLGSDTNDADVGPDPLGDDNFCLPASASLRVKIGGCLDIDGDFDGVPYKFTWPGSISNPVADQLLNATPIRFTSPVSGGSNYATMAFESNISRSESDDTAFGVNVFCQRHITNPADPHPGVGCVNPPPNSEFYPFYSTINGGGTCWWQQGGPYIPGTTNKFGGSAAAEYGPLRVISYPTAPFGTITTRFNDFRSATVANPCPAS